MDNKNAVPADLAQLRALAQAAHNTNGKTSAEIDGADAAFSDTVGPAAILALLDRLERAERPSGKPEPLCDTCFGHGVVYAGSSGLDSDGNAPLTEPCPECGYGDTAAPVPPSVPEQQPKQPQDDRVSASPGSSGPMPESASLRARPLLYTEMVNDQQVCRDDLWIVTTSVVNRVTLLPAARPVQAWSGELPAIHDDCVARDFDPDTIVYSKDFTERYARASIAAALEAAAQKCDGDYKYELGTTIAPIIRALNKLAPGPVSAPFGAAWMPYHSALSQCAELLDNMKDGDPITDVPKFLAEKLAPGPQVGVPEGYKLMPKSPSESVLQPDGWPRMEYARYQAMLAAAPSVSQDTDECQYCEGQGEVQGQGRAPDINPPIIKCHECGGTGKV